MTIFTNKAQALEELKSDRLIHAAETYLGGQFPSPATLWRKLQAAEADMARKLGVPLEPTVIFPDEPTEAEVEALNGKPYQVEPGYDLPPDFFRPPQFGALMLRVRPVIAIESIKLVFPSMETSVFTVPDNWIQLDKKFGQVQIIPGPGAMYGSLGMFALSAMQSGSSVPHMVRVKYRAGIDATKPENADVYDLVMQAAVLRCLQDAFPASSGSISADGLSQSISADIGKLQGEFDDRVYALKQKLTGPVWGVL